MKKISKLKKLQKTAALISELLKSLEGLNFQDREYLSSQITGQDLILSLTAAKDATADLIADCIFCPSCKSENVILNTLGSKFEAGKADFEVVNIHCKSCLKSFSEL